MSVDDVVSGWWASSLLGLLWLLDVGEVVMGGGMGDAGGILGDMVMVVGPRQWLLAGCGQSTMVRS